jgi:uncharacterized phage protein gp47/JayE
MTTYGITDAGFSLKRLSDILTDMDAALANVQDPVSGEYLTPNLLDENDPLVLLANAISDSLSVAWEQLQLSYNQFDPLKATGAGLSGLVQLNGLYRKIGTPASAVFTITGLANKIVAAGVQIGDINDLVVFTLPEFTFDEYGNASAVGVCTTNGDISYAPGTLYKIVTPTYGLTTAVNAATTTGGSADETDSALRLRQQVSTSATARSIVDAIYSLLAGIEGVTHVRVYQNNTLTTDSRGIPAKSIAAVVVGGDQNLISTALFSSVPMGAGIYGNTQTIQYDAQGIEYEVDFTRPTAVPIYVSVDIEIINSSLWTTDGADNIKAAIVAWATQGALGVGITEGYDRDGYVPGDSVYASELYTPVNKQLGIKINSLVVGTSFPAIGDHVTIDWDEIASFSTANIEVTYLGDSSS